MLTIILWVVLLLYSSEARVEDSRSGSHIWSTFKKQLKAAKAALSEFLNESKTKKVRLPEACEDESGSICHSFKERGGCRLKELKELARQYCRLTCGYCDPKYSIAGRKDYIWSEKLESNNYLTGTSTTTPLIPETHPKNLGFDSMFVDYFSSTQTPEKTTPQSEKQKPKEKSKHKKNLLMTLFSHNSHDSSEEEPTLTFPQRGNHYNHFLTW